MKKKTNTNKLVKVVGKGHSQCLSDSILDCYGKECYTNIQFICKQQHDSSKRTLSANKAVLAASSRKLAHLLAETMDEDVTTIMIPDRDYCTVKSLLQYIYAGEVLVNSLNDELESLISEWDIAAPEITPFESGMSMRPELRSSWDDVSVTNHHGQHGVDPLSLSMDSRPRKRTSASGPSLSPSKKRLKLSLDQEADESFDYSPPETVDLATDDVNANPDKSPRPSTSTLQRVTGTKTKRAAAENSYVFLATYIQTSKGKLKENVPSKPDKPTALNSRAKTYSKKSSPVSEAGEPSEDATTNLDEQLEKAAPKKSVSKLPRKSLVNKTNTPTEEDNGPDTPEVDPVEDRADLLLAQSFLAKEKQKHDELASTVENLRDMVERHKDYAKHFLGSESTNEVVRIPCLTCGKLVHRDYMSTHVSIHSTERPYLCDQCGATFVLPDRLRKHIKYAHMDESQMKLHVCTICSKPFKKANYLKRHMTLHQGVKPYSCPYCDKTFRLPNVLLKHKRIHTGERPYECQVCHRRFSARTNFVIHCRRHKRNQVTAEAVPFVDPDTQMLKCDVCGAAFHREHAFLTHMAAHKGEEPKLPCRYCPETFRSPRLLKEHSVEQHADLMFQCDQCPRIFFNKTSLNNHIAIHAEANPYTCEECNKGFQTKAHLANHRRSAHSDERPFVCRFCGKAYKSKITLAQHERIHTGERPYICPYCPKAFRQDVHLANHVRLHTGEKPFVCQYCDKAFNNKNNLGIHIKIHTGQKNQCGVCGLVFRSIVKLREHESTHSPHEDPLRQEDISVQGEEDDE